MPGAAIIRHVFKHLPLSIWADDVDTFSPSYITGSSSSSVHESHEEGFPGRSVGRRDLITWLARSPRMRLLVYFLCRVMSNEQSKENEMSGACGTYDGRREIRGET